MDRLSLIAIEIAGLGGDNGRLVHSKLRLPQKKAQTISIFSFLSQIILSSSAGNSQEISLRLRPQEISRVSENLLGVGDGFPNTSLVLVEHGYNVII